MKGLLMIEPLYHQTVKGNKTQTRREGILKVVNENPDEWSIEYDYHDGTICFAGAGEGNFKILKPRLKVGEVVYLKEPYAFLNGQVWYKFNKDNNGYCVPDRWKNKLFMPSDTAREFVKVTGVRCERLLDISDEDCEAEGIEISEKGPEYGFKYYIKTNTIENMVSRFNSFISLFKFANKTKEVPNLWVWVYEFVRCDKEGKILS
jgi:hypothetical protein